MKTSAIVFIRYAIAQVLDACHNWRILQWIACARAVLFASQNLGWHFYLQKLFNIMHFMDSRTIWRNYYAFCLIDQETKQN